MLLPLFFFTGYSLISIKSVFGDCQHDRIWKFGCGYNEAAKEHCHWSHGFANDEKEGINFRCPNNGFVSGENHAKYTKSLVALYFTSVLQPQLYFIYFLYFVGFPELCERCWTVVKIWRPNKICFRS